MCNNVKSSVRLQLCFHLADTYFQLLSIFVSPSLSLSAFHHFIVHLHSFIVPLCTSHLFQCFITARLTSSSTPFFPHTHTQTQTCLLPVYLFFSPSSSCSCLPSLSPLSPFPQFILLLLFASWLQQCTSRPLSAWSGCLWQCECVLHGLSDWVSSLHTKGQ